MTSTDEQLEAIFNRRQRFWYFALEGREIVRISKLSVRPLGMAAAKCLFNSSPIVR